LESHSSACSPPLASTTTPAQRRLLVRIAQGQCASFRSWFIPLPLFPDCSFQPPGPGATSTSLPFTFPRLYNCGDSFFVGKRFSIVRAGRRTFLFFSFVLCVFNVNRTLKISSLLLASGCSPLFHFLFLRISISVLSPPRDPFLGLPKGISVSRQDGTLRCKTQTPTHSICFYLFILFGFLPSTFPSSSNCICLALRRGIPTSRFFS
jgi:hypothetical protein